MLFEDDEDRAMFAALFEEEAYCAVVEVAQLAAGIVTFGKNSWRGDHFEAELRPMVKAWLEKHGSNRLGPFSMPILDDETA